ncbi:MAG: aminotransferase class I/II-fold pyridoxal phosphate-dependent enzyme [Chlorobi bacterium]|nr:aminotransferase class I/II-fold pyridoxal phosphate-dependent enzyme [Chlorobiota bacterium]
MIHPADRISEVKEYYFSVKLKEIDAMRRSGIDVLNLGIGNPDMPPAGEVINELTEQASKDNNHGYQSYIGIPELRDAFSSWYAKYYDVVLDPASEILPLIGSKEGIMHISMAFLNPGDGVLVPNPGYPTYSSVSKLVGADIISYDLKEENEWLPDLAELEKHDLSKVKLMWINYPNMPTGANAKPEFFRKIIEFGKKHDILICNDNPYSFILNDNPQSILKIDGAKESALELNSLSKSHNMAGWRVGMVAASKEIISYILRVKSNMDSGMFKPLQLAAVKALSLGNDWYTEVNVEYIKRRRLVWEIMDTLDAVYDKEQTGMFVWAKIPAKYQSSRDLSDLVLDKAHVFITPGFIFGSNGEKYIRISLCSNREMLKDALRRIKNM